MEQSEWANIDLNKYVITGGYTIIDVPYPAAYFQDCDTHAVSIHEVDYTQNWFCYVPKNFLSTDADGDGHNTLDSCMTPHDDCDDNDPTTYPGATEKCGDCKDNNCNEKKDEDCCKIKSFGGLEDYKSNPPVLDPINGGNLTFIGSITGACDYFVTSTVTVPEKKPVTIPGGGSSISATWNGKMSDGKVVEEGSHTAELKASTEVCPNISPATTSFTVKPFCDMYATSCSCQLQVIFGSSAHIASGNLYHSQTLFTVSNAKSLGDFTLSYNSLDSYSGPLGKGWTHSYNITLKDQGDVAVVMEADGKRGLLYKNNDTYTPRNSPYPRLTKNTDGTYSLLHKDGTVYSFDPGGKITAIADRNNNTATFGYDGSGNLLTATDSMGRTTAFAYDGNNKLASVLDPMGKLHTVSYKSGYPSTVTTQTTNGETRWSYTYDSSGYMLSKIDPAGNVTAYTYDTDHRALTSTDPEGKVKSISYPTDISSTIRTTTVTEKDGGLWTYTYDLSGMTLTSKTDPEGNTTSYTYDTSGNRLSATESDGTVTSYTYDSERNMSSSTDADGHTTHYTYNELGQVTSIIDPEGRTTAYAYDIRGNMTSMTDLSGVTATYEYDSKGNVISITDSEGRVTTYTYDAAGFMSSIKDATGATTSFTYDAAGNTVTTIGPDGNTTYFTYDDMNRLVSVTDAQGNTSGFTYDLLGNKTSTTDANGNTTRYEYNYRGQITKVTDAMGGATTYTYGGTGCPSCGGGTDKLTSITDANGNTTQYEYDLLGRLTKETDPEGNVINYSYDSTGNLMSKTDASGVTIDYAYDSLRRLTNIHYPDPSDNISYTYDATGKVLTMTDASGVTTYTYDNSNRLIYETKTMDGISYATSYTYTAGGSLSSITYPSGRTVTYNHDPFGRTASVTEAKDSATKDVIKNITYNTNGTVSAITYGNSLVTTKDYDLKGALNSMNIGALKSLSYTRDNVGNIISIIDNPDPAKTKTYAYDGLYRLTQAVGPWGTIQYTYDPVGNRTVETTGSGVTNYAYAANKLLSSTGVKSFTFDYDNNGNTIAESRPLNAERSFAYNQNQRLIKATENNRILGEYVYNGNGQRVKKTANGKTTYFFYDQSGNLIEEADGEGKPIADYIYLGGTPIGRVDMNKDNMPPVTEISVGAPGYQSFISAVTQITLSAADEGNPPSGVDYTEYRVDDEALWTRYSNAFNLATYSEGAHVISYRSIDKAGNLEDAKTLTVILDGSASESSILIGSPQYQSGGKLYIGGNTQIVITVADVGSGVGKIEYKVDGEEYSLYSGAFNLSDYADGSHTIAYRSMDNVLNLETKKSFSIMLDSAAPSTTISASDELIEGGTNTVSPRTRFFLNSSDSGTGIRESQYRIDNGAWSAYLVGFPLPGVAGTHTIVFRAIDNVGNEEAEKTLTVNMIVIDVTKEISLEPVVLAGAWRQYKDGEEHDNESPAEGTINTLADILLSSGMRYYIPQSEDEFKESVRRGKYNTYLLVDFDKEGLGDELKEAVNYGDGLVYIKTTPDEEEDKHSLSEVFGVEFRGMSTNKDMVVDLTESPISGASTLQSTGKAVKTSITASTAGILGTVTDKREIYPVIVSNQYGRGKIILFSFDLLNSPEQNKAKDLLINAIKYVAPSESFTRAMSDVPISISVQNSSETVDVKVTESIPAETAADCAYPATEDNSHSICHSGLSGIFSPGSTATWNLTVEPNELKQLGYWLTLPDTTGEYQLGTELRYSNQGSYRLYGNYNLTVNVLNSSAGLLEEIITDLEALTVSVKDRKHIEEAIEELGEIKADASTRKKAEENIEGITEVIEELDKVSVDVSSIRLKLDELLKIWQKKWSLLPEEKEHDEEKDNDGDHDRDGHEDRDKHSWLERYRLTYGTDARKMNRKVADSPCPSFPRTVIGNPEGRCGNTFLVASAGSLNGLNGSGGLNSSSEALYFYHTDHLGTPIMMTDTSGAVVWEGEFMPFGEAYSITGTITNNLRFPGQYYDEETGKHHNSNRTYNPNVGRYHEKDPVGLNGGVNLYLYAKANPLFFIDPLGLKPCCDAKLPASPIKEVSLTCFAEASNSCSQGGSEKRAITDCVYNRVSKNRSYWGGNTVIGVLSYPGQLLGYGSTQYKKAENPKELV